MDRAKIVLGLVVLGVVVLVGGVWLLFDLFLVAPDVPPSKVSPRIVSPTDSGEYFQADGADDTVTRYAEYAAIVREVADAARSREFIKAMNRVDSLSIFDRAQSVDLSPYPPLPRRIGSLDLKLINAINDAFDTDMLGLPWQHVQILHIEALGPSEAVAYCRHIDRDTVTAVRWSLTRTDKGIRLTDLEDARTGYRLSQAVACCLGYDLPDAKAADLKRFQHQLDELLRQIDRGDSASATRLLPLIRSTEAPKTLEARRTFAEGLIAVAEKKSDANESLAQRLESVPAAARELLGRWAMANGDRNQAEKKAIAWESVCGPAPWTLAARASAIAARGEVPQAEELIARGRKLFPDSTLLKSWTKP